MRIQNNIMAMNAHRSLGNNNNATAKSLEKLSSGYRINRAGDDAAGLAISEKMRAQIKGLETASKNANDGISLVQTAEGALTEVHSMLNRMSELATQSANGTYQDAVDREALQSEISALSSEIDRIATTTNFNGIKLLDGNIGASATAGAGYNDGTLDLSGAGAIVTGVQGASIKDGSAVSTATATGSELAFTVTDANGNATTKVIDIADVIKSSTGGSYTDAAGAKGVIDLTSVGLGKIEFTSDGTAGALFADNLAGELDSVFTAGVTFNAGAGATGGALELQVGDTSDPSQKVTISIGSMSADSLGIGNIDIGTQGGGSAAIDSIKDAINTVSSQRASLGAVQNRLEHTVNNLGVAQENIQAAESRIRDVDMAKEMMTFTKNNILTQAAQAMLAQANQQPQGVLQLLR